MKQQIFNRFKLDEKKTLACGPIFPFIETKAAIRTRNESRQRKTIISTSKCIIPEILNRQKMKGGVKTK